MAKQKPSVKTRCVANYHAAANERIIEFHFGPKGGGLIAFRLLDDGTAQVAPYRVDAGIQYANLGTMQRIAGILDGQEWSADTCDEIARLMRADGFTVREMEGQ